jgi:hypothetical protein
MYHAHRVNLHVSQVNVCYVHDTLIINLKQNLKFAHMCQNMSPYTETPSAENSVVLTEIK